MIEIRSTSLQSISSVLSELREKLIAHAENGQGCETFFDLYSTPWIPIQPHDLAVVQFKHDAYFSKMFSCISENQLEQWKETYRTLCEDTSLIDTNELDRLKIQIELSEKTNKVFCEKFIQLMQNNAEALLHRDGDIFFLAGPVGVIGECHCCSSMKRASRSSCSHNIMLKIAHQFPDKKPLSIASIGAGGCFHELEIHTLASLRGCPISEWVLVDPELRSSVVKDFTTMVNWATPNTTITAVKQMADEYFANLQNSTGMPDVFLFFDVDRHIRESEFQAYAQKMNHLCLFANFSQKKRSFHPSNVTQ